MTYNAGSLLSADSRELATDLWSSFSSMCGVDINEQYQMELLRQFQSTFRSEYDRFPTSSCDPRCFHLAFNNTFEVLRAGSFLHLQHAEGLKAAFTSYNQSTVWPGFWMRRRRNETSAC